MHDEEVWSGAGFVLISDPEGWDFDFRDRVMDGLDNATVRRALLAKRHDDLGAYVWLLTVEAIRAATAYATARGPMREQSRRDALGLLEMLAWGLPPSFTRARWTWPVCSADAIELVIECLANRLADEVLSVEWTCPDRFGAALDDLREAVALRVS